MLPPCDRVDSFRIDGGFFRSCLTQSVYRDCKRTKLSQNPHAVHFALRTRISGLHELLAVSHHPHPHTLPIQPHPGPAIQVPPTKAQTPPFCPPPPSQKIANTFGGLATPPGTLHGSLLTKKLQRPSRLHVSASVSSQNSSPMGQPKPASSTSCSTTGASAGAGHASKLGWSPATAAKCSQIQRAVGSVCASPPKWCGSRDWCAWRVAVGRLASCACQPGVTAVVSRGTRVGTVRGGRVRGWAYQCV